MRRTLILLISLLTVLPAAAKPRSPDLARLDLDVAPEEAHVYLDGTFMGIADDFDGRPDVLYTEPGSRVLELRLKEHQTLRILLALKPGETHRFGQELVEIEDLEKGQPEVRVLDLRKPDTSRQQPPPPGPPGKALGYLLFQVEPSDAAIWLDQAYLGLAGDLDERSERSEVATGAHLVEIARPGYRSHRLHVTLGSEEVRRIRVQLERSVPGGE